MTQKKSKGQVEAEISNALIAFEKEHMGRGPVDVRSHIIEDMILIRLKGVLTP
nr:Na-translocating system protein MpsC family protein [Desulfobacula sp.]